MFTAVQDHDHPDPVAGGGADPHPGAPPEGMVPAAVARLIWQTLQPASGAGVAAWAGLTDGLPVRPTAQVAADSGIAANSFGGRLSRVRRTGAAMMLSPTVRLEASRRSLPGEDHQRRVRWAWLLGCDRPAAAADGLSAADSYTARRAAAILDATGGLPLAQLLTAMARAGRPLVASGRGLTADGLTTLLRVSQFAAEGPDRRWYATGNAPPRPRYRALVAAARASGRTRHSSAQMTELLRQAGYTNPGGNSTSYHPLLHKVRRNLWEVRGATDT